jgi:hyperosmotically inducible periplasmic protein
LEMTMKSITPSMIVLAGLLGATMCTPGPLRAQENPADQQMHESGATAKEALRDAGQSLKHAYRATRDEAHDAALTTKVKTALLEDREARKFAIHVTSNQGTVTLVGVVDSPEAAARARSVAAAVNGVQAVNNRLTWHTSAR